MAASFNVLSIGQQPIMTSYMHNGKNKNYREINIHFRMDITKAGIAGAVMAWVVRSFPLNVRSYKIKNIIIQKKSVLQFQHLASGHQLFFDQTVPSFSMNDSMFLGISTAFIDNTPTPLVPFVATPLIREYELCNFFVPQGFFDFNINEDFDIKTDTNFLVLSYLTMINNTNADIEFSEYAIMERYNLASATYEWLAECDYYTMKIFIEY